MQKKYILYAIVSVALCLLVTVTWTRQHSISNQFGTNNLNEMQWWLSNNGTFNHFDDSKTAWGVDQKKALRSVDLNIGKEVSQIKQKRTLLIAAIDSAVDIDHPALAGKIYVNTNEVKNDMIDNDANGYIDDYMGWDFYEKDNSIKSESEAEMLHGTAMLGLLIGNDDDNGYGSLLSEYSISVLCIRVLGSKKNSGNLESIAKAIQYAENMGAAICAIPINTDIDSGELKEIMLKSKMLFIVSAGNEGIDLDEFEGNYPTCYRLKNVISVADVRCDGGLSETSNYGGSVVDIAAPGTNILCAKAGGGYGFYSGTSLSAYQVASEAALVYINSEVVLSAQDIKNVIVKNTTALNELQGKIASGGIPNFEKAISCIH